MYEEHPFSNQCLHADAHPPVVKYDEHQVITPLVITPGLSTAHSSHALERSSYAIDSGAHQQPCRQAIRPGPDAHPEAAYWGSTVHGSFDAAAALAASSSERLASYLRASVSQRYYHHTTQHAGTGMVVPHHQAAAALLALNSGPRGPWLDGAGLNPSGAPSPTTIAHSAPPGASIFESPLRGTAHGEGVQRRVSVDPEPVHSRPQPSAAMPVYTGTGMRADAGTTAMVVPHRQAAAALLPLNSGPRGPWLDGAGLNPNIYLLPSDDTTWL